MGNVRIMSSKPLVLSARAGCRHPTHPTAEVKHRARDRTDGPKGSVRHRLEVSPGHLECPLPSPCPQVTWSVPCPHPAAMAEWGQWLSAQLGLSASCQGKGGVLGLSRERDWAEVPSSSRKLSQHTDALHPSIFHGKVRCSKAGAIQTSGEIISHTSRAAPGVCLACDPSF